MLSACLGADTSILPKWVPLDAFHYLAHTVSGQSIRSLARKAQCHPSTVMRQVQSCELRRDDPLIDAALKTLSVFAIDPGLRAGAKGPDMLDTSKVNHAIANTMPEKPATLKTPQFEAAALLILRRLCEHGAVLAVARDMPTAVIVREDSDGGTVRTASVENDVAQALALKAWITAQDPAARVVRYVISGRGRDALQRLMAASENRAQGFRDRTKGSDDAANDLDAPERYQVTETPLVALARRKGTDGQPFLTRELIRAGELLREDFELSHFGEFDDTDWANAFNAANTSGIAPAVVAARGRVALALDDLGPGLAEAALQCCCLLNGLEVTEKKMGWSARSGKVVLRIALQRLHQYQTKTVGKFGPMIG